MERAIITINESGKVNIPSGNVWVSEMELVELFGVIAPTLHQTILSIYRLIRFLNMMHPLLFTSFIFFNIFNNYNSKSFN